MSAGSAVPGGAFRAAAAGEPNPALAGFLGLIPGVGAMFNGQYAKGVIHLIVFVVLVSLADNLSWVLWWLVWGWIFYQAFEAYHTAQARRDGQPLPDPFGWNELGERMGFSRSWAPAAGTGNARTPATPPPPFSAVREDAGGADEPARATASYPPPPSTPFSTPFAAPVPPYAPPTPAGASPYQQVPYTSTFHGGVEPLSGQPTRGIGSPRFPVGAIWLIVLGVLFLLGNLLPNWHLDGRWLVPILLAAVAVWMASSRLVSLRSSAALRSGGLPQPSLAENLMIPVLLFTVAVLLALQDASWLPFRRSWPLLLIVWGAMLMFDRVRGLSPPAFPPEEAGPTPTEPDRTAR